MPVSAPRMSEVGGELFIRMVGYVMSQWAIIVSGRKRREVHVCMVSKPLDSWYKDAEIAKLLEAIVLLQLI